MFTQLTATEKDHDEVREEARQLMMEIQAKSVEYDEGRKVSVDIHALTGYLHSGPAKYIYLRLASCMCAIRAGYMRRRSASYACSRPASHESAISLSTHACAP